METAGGSPPPSAKVDSSRERQAATEPGPSQLAGTRGRTGPLAAAWCGARRLGRIGQGGGQQGELRPLSGTTATAAEGTSRRWNWLWPRQGT
uniref:Uncharacterized protein n=1 Tax=Sphaerodactylus townsendi TaxID=933632 RepID=A0ACB8FB00_9SAUR